MKIVLPRFASPFATLVTLVTIFSIACSPVMAPAQSDISRRPLEHDDYDVWNTLGRTQMSRDGQWVCYEIRTGVGGSETTLMIRHTTKAKEFKIARGSNAQFSFDSQFAFYYQAPPKKKDKSDDDSSSNRSDRAGRLFRMLELKTGELVTVENVRSFAKPQKNGRWVAWLLRSPSTDDQLNSQTSAISETYEITPEGLKRPTKKLKLKKRESNEGSKTKTANKNPNPQESKNTKKTDKPQKEQKPKKKKTTGTTLVLHHLSTQTRQSFPDVVSFEFSKFGDSLAFVTATDADSAESKSDAGLKSNNDDQAETPQDGVTVVELESLDKHRVLTGVGNYKNLAFNEDGSQLAFITDRDDYQAKSPTWTLYHWKSRSKQAKPLATEGDAGLRVNWWVTPQSDLRFAEDGKRLYFETAPIPEAVLKERQAKSTANKKADASKKKIAKLDIWHWQDPQLQPQQLFQAAVERQRDYRAAYVFRSKKIVQLADQEMPQLGIDLRSESKLAVANSNVGYRKMLSWDVPGFLDVFLINLDTGARQTVLEKVKFRAALSPHGKFLTWFDAEQEKWFAKSTTDKDSEVIEISDGIEFPLQNELEDRPTLPNAYGNAGWVGDDEAFLVYDRYDIWQLDPTGDLEPINLTGGYGRDNEIQFRYVNLDREQRTIDLGQPMVLRAFNEQTKASGYWLLDAPTMDEDQNEDKKDEDEDDDEDETDMRQLIMLDENVTQLRKAELSDNVVFTRSSFRMCPDLWATTMKFDKLHRLSDVNPQQEDYTWGTAELVHWDASDGQKLDGILYKPDGFDPQKKYPMLVNFYERSSDRLHRYYPPAPGRSSICHSFYVSRGYLVFVPDVTYKTGEPGPSAVNAILPGIQHLIDQGFVDEERIGTQGHSWGGYQVAYLVTKTDMFACAESGAPVSNMTSAYGGIRWASGMSRMFQYERTQSRIGEDLWSARDKYIANSPLFFADKINTPLLILHNDQDGAVPWYQGIELFVALRRLEKRCWMLNYNGDPHWVMGDVNRRDFAIRMQQFFDHYLKDAPEPQWMAVGVPAVDKGKESGLELLEPEPETTESSSQ